MAGRSRPAVIVIAFATLLGAGYAHFLLTRLPAYNRLHAGHPWYFVELIDKGFVVAIVAAGLIALYGVRPREMAKSVGLMAPILPAILFAVAAVAPMAIGFALTRKFRPAEGLGGLLFMDLLSPMVEELHLRGFGFRQPRLLLRWPFWAAMVPQAIVMGLGHIDKAMSTLQVGQMLLLFFTGAAVFSWLLERWESLWVPFCLHAAMNGVWDFFSVSDTILGGWFPFVIQQLAIINAIVLTLWLKKARGSKAEKLRR
jgi:membrane protease YdiL (CAAX protease family)